MTIDQIIHEAVVAVLAVALFVYIAIGVVVIMKRMYATYTYATHTVAFLGTLFIGLWSATALAQFIHPIAYVENLSCICTFLFITAYPTVTLVFPFSPFRARHIWWAVPTIIGALIALIPGAAATTVRAVGYGYPVPTGGWILIPYRIMHLVYISSAAAILIYRMCLKKNKKIRPILAYGLFALVALGGTGAVTNVVLPLFGIYTFYPAGALLGLTFATSILAMITIPIKGDWSARR